MTKSTKRARELKLFTELQRSHGYMLAKMPREADRYTTQVRKIGSVEMTMTPARVVRLIVPDDSALGQALAKEAKAKVKAKAGGRTTTRGK